MANQPMFETVNFQSSNIKPYPLEVVGEASYKENISSLFSELVLDKKDGVDKDDFFAKLILEDQNCFDPKAVRIDIENKTVGYLSKANARLFRQRLIELGSPTITGECYASIRGGQQIVNGITDDFSVFLDLDLTKPLKKIVPNITPSKNIPTSSVKQKSSKGIFNSKIVIIVFTVLGIFLLCCIITLIIGLIQISTSDGHATSTAQAIISQFIPTQTAPPPTTPPIPSDTSAPTNTHTPALTPTPTITLTLTIASTPTQTLTPTNSLPPSPTLPYNVASCIPKDTLRQVGSVVSITDGDTIMIQLDDGNIYSVRYIGIDSPEQGEIGYEPSASKNTELVHGKYVTLIGDVSEVDRYNRLLRYVVVGDTFVNDDLIRSGLATAYYYPPDIACSSTFSDSEQYAKDNYLGMWVAMPTLQITIPSRGGSNCDSAYPDVCIPSPPPDLDCKDILFRRFRVLPPDPHNFDGDHDGVGCET